MERKFEKMMKNNKLNWLISIGVIIFSAFVYSIGVVLFVSEAKMLASGVSGISLIIGRLIEESGLVNYTEAQISGIFYFILKVLNTKNIIISTLSITTSFIAASLQALRSRYYALAYSLNDLVLIILWSLAIKEDLSYLSLVICFIIWQIPCI